MKRDERERREESKMKEKVEVKWSESKKRVSEMEGGSLRLAAA
jgi:hypothetical protein